MKTTKTTSTQKRTVQDATRSVMFRITKENIANACPRDPETCVVAQALSATLGDLIEGWQVGARITKLYMKGGVEVRYATPSALTQSIRAYDVTEEWKLPVGEYELLPPPPSERIGYVAPPHKRNIKRKLDPNRGRGHNPRLSSTRTLPKAGTIPVDYSQRNRSKVKAA